MTDYADLNDRIARLQNDLMGDTMMTSAFAAKRCRELHAMLCDCWMACLDATTPEMVLRPPIREKDMRALIMFLSDCVPLLERLATYDRATHFDTPVDYSAIGYYSDTYEPRVRKPDKQVAAQVTAWFRSQTINREPPATLRETSLGMRAYNCLANAYPEETTWEDLREATLDDFMMIEGVGIKTATEIVTWRDLVLGLDTDAAS